MRNRFDSLAEQFRTQGHKLTRPRRIILETLLAASCPLSPADIADQEPEVGLVTVYRTLELMESMGIARAVHVTEGCHGYVLVSPGHTHHLVCERCHAVVEIVGCELDHFLETVAQYTGYTVTGHWLEISGVCAACRH
jgi:Fur family transcriptional regulator, ferric uptake regulator